jgi:protein-disulfide isomerase
MSRSRTRERREERQREQRRQRQLAVVVGLVAMVIVAVVVIVLVNLPAEAPIPAESAERYAGIEQGETDEGYPVLGNPDSPVQVVEYSSFACTACKSFHDEVFPAIVQRIRTGDVALTYVPMYSFGSVQNGQGAAWAAICVGEQGEFWPFHDALFNWQGLYGNGAFAQNRLASGIDNVGIDRGAWEQCISSDLPRSVADAAEAEARALDGFTGTPTVVVNGAIVQNDLASVTSAIDQALAFAPPAPDTPPPAEPEITEESAVESTAEATAAP